MNEIWERVLTGVVTLALLSWIWARSTKRTDELETRVVAVEKACAQYVMLHAEVMRMFEAGAQARKEMHEENLRNWRELREDIGDNEKRRSKTEHDILDKVNTITTKAAEIAAVERFKQEHGFGLNKP
jgi:hypothetical protein